MSSYNVGDFCRCTYTDGIDYEASIIEINKEEETCRIRYVGYNNEENAVLSSLSPTSGLASRRKQCLDASYVPSNSNDDKDSISSESVVIPSESSLIKTLENVNIQGSDVSDVSEDIQRKVAQKENKKYIKKDLTAKQTTFNDSNLKKNFSDSSDDDGVDFEKKKFVKKEETIFPNSRSGFNVNAKQTTKINMQKKNILEMKNGVNFDGRKILPPSFLLTGNEHHHEAISKMLHSWYICGYYTGRYESTLLDEINCKNEE